MGDRLKGKVAVITGSDSGIGRATAIRFAREGADVCVHYHTDEDGAAATSREIERAGRRAIVVQADVGDERHVDALFDRTVAGLGRPHVLVNNAAVNYSGVPVADMTTEDWDLRIRTNLYGPFFCCRRFIRERRADGGGGRIVNVTSVHEEAPMIGGAAYDASKGGLRNLTRTLALELAGDRINVNNLAPGMILTPMNREEQEDPAKLREAEAAIPWKRAGQPEEVAGLALWLASDEADYVTGQTFVIDGGLLMLWGQGA